MHHLGVGTPHARKRVLALADDHHITVIELDTGEVLSTHLIEPEHAPTGATKTRSPAAGRAPRTETHVPSHVRHMSRLITTAERGGFEPPMDRKTRTGFRDRHGPTRLQGFQPSWAWLWARERAR